MCTSIQKTSKQEVIFEKTFDKAQLKDNLWPCEKYVSALKCCRFLWDILKNRWLQGNKVDNTASYHLEDVIDISTNIITTNMEVEIIKDVEDLKLKRKPKNTHTIQKQCSAPLVEQKSESNACKKANFEESELVNQERHRRRRSRSKKHEDKANNKKEKSHKINSDANYGCELVGATNTKITCSLNEPLMKLYNHDSFVLSKVEINKSYIKIKSSRDTSVSCKLDEQSKWDKKIQELNRKVSKQNRIINKIAKENEILREDINVLQSDCTWKAIYGCGGSRKYRLSIIPKSEMEEGERDRCIVKDDRETKDSPESEIEVSMRKYATQTHKNVHMVRVVHKSNYEQSRNIDLNHKAFQNTDACDMLSQVHNMFGAILKREKDFCQSKANNNLQPNLPLNYSSHHKRHADKSHSFLDNTEALQKLSTLSASRRIEDEKIELPI